MMDPSLIVSLLKEGETHKTEFKEDSKSTWKNLNREICGFANSDGGYILIGVSDNGEITGLKAKDYRHRISAALQSLYPPPKIRYETIKIGDKEILVIIVSRSEHLVTIENKYAYIRIGTGLRMLTLNEIVARKIHEGPVFFDSSACPDATIDDLNKEYIARYLDARRKLGFRVSEDMEKNLIKLKIATKKDGELIPTNAGVLCFAEDPAEFIPAAKLLVVEFYSEENLREYRELKEFRGPIWKVIDDVVSFLAREKVRRFGGFRAVARRIEFEEYPILALREAITNALVHKNYYIPAEVQIRIFPSMIEIRNPGPLPENLDLDNPEHIPRNPILCEILWIMRYIEKFGSGIILMRNEAKKHPLVNFYIDSTKAYTTVRFIKEKRNFEDPIIIKILDALSIPRTSSELAQIVGVSKPTVIQRLKYLMELGIVRSSGKGPRTIYILSAKVP